MSFEFQSTLVNVTPQYRIAGNQIGGLRIEYKGDVKVARLVVTNDRDITFSLSPLFTLAILTRSMQRWQPICMKSPRVCF